MSKDFKNTVWIIAFVLSLMANAFFVGMMVTHHKGPHGPMHDGPPNPFMRMHESARDLSTDDKRIVEDVIASHQAASHQRFAALDNAFAKLDSVLTGPEYDPAALVEAHKTLAEADVAMKADMEKAIDEIATRLPPQARITFFKNMLPPATEKPLPAVE